MARLSRGQGFLWHLSPDPGLRGCVGLVDSCGSAGCCQVARPLPQVCACHTRTRAHENTCTTCATLSFSATPLLRPAICWPSVSAWASVTVVVSPGLSRPLLSSAPAAVPGAASAHVTVLLHASVPSVSLQSGAASALHPAALWAGAEPQRLRTDRAGWMRQGAACVLRTEAGQAQSRVPHCRPSDGRPASAVRTEGRSTAVGSQEASCCLRPITPCFLLPKFASCKHPPCCPLSLLLPLTPGPSSSQIMIHQSCC